MPAEALFEEVTVHGAVDARVLPVVTSSDAGRPHLRRARIVPMECFLRAPLTSSEDSFGELLLGCFDTHADHPGLSRGAEAGFWPVDGALPGG